MLFSFLSLKKPEFYKEMNSLQMNSANHLRGLRSKSFPRQPSRWGWNPANTLISTLWAFEQRTQLRQPRLLTYRKYEIRNEYCLKLLSSVICCTAQKIIILMTWFYEYHWSNVLKAILVFSFHKYKGILNICNTFKPCNNPRGALVFLLFTFLFEKTDIHWVQT